MAPRPRRWARLGERARPGALACGQARAGIRGPGLSLAASESTVTVAHGQGCVIMMIVNVKLGTYSLAQATSKYPMLRTYLFIGYLLRRSLAQDQSGTY